LLWGIGAPHNDWTSSLDVDSMPHNLTLVLVLLLGRLVLPASAYAQLTPPAGSVGAGNSAISGVPFGPANPSVLSDPSGIGNASRLPPLGTNAPLQPPVYGPIGSPLARAVAATMGTSQRVFSADQIDSRRPPVRRRPPVSKFKGICRGC
jgi:hypothetical protein